MRVRTWTVLLLVLSEFIVLLMGVLAYQRGMHYPATAALMGALTLTLPYLLERMGWVRLPLFVQAWAALAIGLHSFGLLLRLYDDVWWWDELTHGVSSSLVGMLAALALYLFDMHSVKIKVPRWAYPMMIMTFAIFIGVVWETGEFLGDMLAGTRMQYSVFDTLNDCYVDMVGGLFTSILWVLWLWRDPSNELRGTAQERMIELFKAVF